VLFRVLYRVSLTVSLAGQRVTDSNNLVRASYVIPSRRTNIKKNEDGFITGRTAYGLNYSPLPVRVPMWIYAPLGRAKSYTFLWYSSRWHRSSLAGNKGRSYANAVYDVVIEVIVRKCSTQTRKDCRVRRKTRRKTRAGKFFAVCTPVHVRSLRIPSSESFSKNPSASLE
jgi:hypothetical protein